MIIFFWIVPIFVARAIGKPKRRACWAYGVFLGWIGVIIVALLPPVPEMTLDVLEKKRNALEKKRDAPFVSPQWYQQKSQSYETKKAELLAAPTYRECPFCKEDMRRDATVCPHCRNESQALPRHKGRRRGLPPQPPGQAPTVAPSSLDSAEARGCPHCKEQMRRDASVCPHCHNESSPWVLKDGEWWHKDPSGSWYWLDEPKDVWVKFEPEPDSRSSPES